MIDSKIKTAPPVSEAPDLREKGGPKNGQPQLLDRRLFVQFTAFGNCRNPQPLTQALSEAGHEGALYADINDPRGIGILTLSENPETFVTTARTLLNSATFAGLEPKPEHALLGRSYSLGYEPNLEDWLLQKPRRTALDPLRPWAVWYPLRRTGAFSQLPHQEQMQILKEHSQIGRSYGDADLAHDVRLACAGLDKNDNDFVIGLIGKELYPLSALIAAMRATKQTSSYIQNMGPFFVGKALWQSPLKTH